MSVGAVAKMESPRKRTRLSREARRAQLLDVAAALVVEQGLDAVTMERLAEQAGVSKGLGYVYFRDRDDLLLALFDREIDYLEGRMNEAARGAGSFEKTLRRTIMTWLEAISERGPVLAALIQAAPIRAPLEERQTRYRRQMEAFWSHLVQKEYGLDRKSAVAAANIFQAGAEGIISTWVGHGGTAKELGDTFVELVLGGLERLAGGPAAR